MFSFQQKQEAQLPLREEGVSMVHSSHGNNILGNLAFFECSHTLGLRVRFWAVDAISLVCLF